MRQSLLRKSPSEALTLHDFGEGDREAFAAHAGAKAVAPYGATLQTIVSPFRRCRACWALRVASREAQVGPSCAEPGCRRWPVTMAHQFRWGSRVWACDEHLEAVRAQARGHDEAMAGHFELEKKKERRTDALLAIVLTVGVYASWGELVRAWQLALMLAGLVVLFFGVPAYLTFGPPLYRRFLHVALGSVVIFGGSLLLQRLWRPGPSLEECERIGRELDYNRRAGFLAY